MKRWNIILLAAVALVAAQSSAQTQPPQLILDGQAIDLNPNLPVTIEETGDIVAFSAAGDLTCSNVTSAPTVSLTVSPTNLTGSGSVTVSWATQFAASCDASGGGATNWSDTTFNLPADASGNTTPLNVSATTTFTLSCTNTLDTTADSATVTVSTGGGGAEYGGFSPPADCPSTQPPPSGTSHQNPQQIQTTAGGVQTVTNNFEGAFGVWPGNAGRILLIDRNKWVALGFVAEPPESCTGGDCARTSGTILWEASNVEDGPKVFSISRCPGDFSTSLGTCWSDRSPLRWAYGSGLGCALTPGATYFLNVIHADSDDPSQTTCGATQCGALVDVF